MIVRGTSLYRVDSPRRTNLKPPIPAPDAIPVMNPCRAQGVLATFAKSSFLIMDTASEIVGLELVEVAPFSPLAVASFCSMGFDQTCNVLSPGLGCPSSWFEAISGYLCGAIGVMNRAHSQKVVLLTWADPMTLSKALQARRLPVWSVHSGRWVRCSVGNPLNL